MFAMNFGLSLTTAETDAELTKLYSDLEGTEMTRVLRGLDYLLKNTDGLVTICMGQYATWFEHRVDIYLSL